jgi:hypothetical protein
MIGFVMGLLGVNRLGAWIVTIGSAGLVVWAADWALDRWIGGIRRTAMSEQKMADELAVKNAQIMAVEKQAKAIEAARMQGIEIGRKWSDEYARDGAGIDSAAAALAGLWGAQAQTGAGGAGRGQAIGISGAATGFDADTICQARGWVSLPLATLIAAGADKEAARGDGLSGFITDNAARWPKE